MRESRTYGSVRGARGNSRPYRVMRQANLVLSSRCKTAPSKEWRPLGSECCVAAGDSGCEAYTAIAWGVGLSHERSDIAGAECFYSREDNTPCEVLSPCRGRRPHHVQWDR
jgi:hypothetical protein